MSLFRPGVIRCSLPEHVEVDGQVSGCGVDAAVAEQLLNGAEITSIIEQMRGHGRTQQVRVHALPWSQLANALEALISTSKPQRLPGVKVNAAPDAPSGAERSTKVCDEQGVGFARARLSAYSQPAIQQAHHFLAKRHYSVISAFAVDDKQGSVGLDGADLQFDELTGTQTGFVKQAHYHVVPVSRQRGQLRCGQQLANLPFGKHAWDALRCSLRLRQEDADIGVNVSEKKSPAVKGPNRRQFIIKRAGANRTAPASDPAIDGGLTR